MYVVDDFLEAPDAVREYVSRLDFSGEGFYPGRSAIVPDTSYFCAKVSEVLGEQFSLAHPEYAAWRLALQGDELQVGVHSDDFRVRDGARGKGCSQWSVVLNLSPVGSPERHDEALSFYYDLRYGRSFMHEHDAIQQRELRHSPSVDPQRHVEFARIQWRSNRCVVFPASTLHCPSGAVGYGTSFADGRLALVMFGYTGVRE